jgi:hypothetical protein
MRELVSAVPTHQHYRPLDCYRFLFVTYCSGTSFLSFHIEVVLHIVKCVVIRASVKIL